MPRGPVPGGPGGPLVRFWRAKLLAEGQRVGRAEMWRRILALWADADRRHRQMALAERAVVEIPNSGVSLSFGPGIYLDGPLET